MLEFQAHWGQSRFDIGFKFLLVINWGGIWSRWDPHKEARPKSFHVSRPGWLMCLANLLLLTAHDAGVLGTLGLGQKPFWYRIYICLVINWGTGGIWSRQLQTRKLGQNPYYSHLSNKRAASLIDFSFFALPARSFFPLLADTFWPLNSLKVTFFDLVINGKNIRWH